MASDIKDLFTIGGDSGSVGGSYSAGTATLNSDNTISQQERLFASRPRSAASGSNLSNRGPHAYIKLLTSSQQKSLYSAGLKNYDGSRAEVSDSAVQALTSDDQSLGYDQFLLTQVSCSLDEKVQVSEVFGDTEVVYYFGKAPIVMSLAGILIDSLDNNWFNDWITAYGSTLRGTRTAQNYQLLKIILPNMEVTGTINSFAWSASADSDMVQSFTMQFLVKAMVPKKALPPSEALSNNAYTLNFQDTSEKFLNQAGININKEAALLGLITSPSATAVEITEFFNSVSSGISGSLGFLKDVSNYFNGISSELESAFGAGSIFESISSGLNGLRTSLFSPIYGVINSLTRLISVGLGSLSSVFNSFINPVRAMLNDISNLSNQVRGLVSMISQTPDAVGRILTNQLGSLKASINSTLSTLSRSSGGVASVPITAFTGASTMFSSGLVAASTPFLSYTAPSLSSQYLGGSGSGTASLSGASLVSSKVAMLSSGGYSPSNAASLSSGTTSESKGASL